MEMSVHQCQFNVSSMSVQCQFNVSSSMSVQPKMAQSESINILKFDISVIKLKL